MSTRLLTTECFEGRCAECVGYNGPADNPNFRCVCKHHESVGEAVEGAPERIWVRYDGLVGTKFSATIERITAPVVQPDEDSDLWGREVEYIRADLTHSVPQASSERDVANEAAVKLRPYLNEYFLLNRDWQDTIATIIFSALHKRDEQVWGKGWPTSGWYWMRGFRQYRPLPVEINGDTLSMMYSTGSYTRADLKGGEEFSPIQPPKAAALRKG